MISIVIINDRKTQSAIERQLAIIGEALVQLQKSEPGITIDNNKQIIGFRNRIIHAYNSVDNSIVWAIIQRHLKFLKQDVLLLIDNLSS